MNILNDDCTVVGEVTKVGLESEIVMNGLDVSRKDLSGRGDGHPSVFEMTAAHVSSTGAMSFTLIR